MGQLDLGCVRPIGLAAPAETTVAVGFPVSLQVAATDSVPGQTLTFHQVPNTLRGAITPPGRSARPAD